MIENMGNKHSEMVEGADEQCSNEKPVLPNEKWQQLRDTVVWQAFELQITLHWTH